MTDLTQKLPVELLVEILGHVSALTILRLKQVNRVFRDVILSSPLIQHKLDLHAVGLEHNPAAGIDLTESQKAFCQYLTSCGALSPIEKRAVGGLRAPRKYQDTKVVGGVYAILKDKVRLFTLGSVSRGIPYKEWAIPLPVTAPQAYGFYPDADVIAFVELLEEPGVEIAIYLRALSNGGFHPAAQFPKISYSQAGVDTRDTPEISISGPRLLLVIDPGAVVIWDWRSAQILFSLKSERYIFAEFIDDYRLFFSLGKSESDPPCVVLMDTEKYTGGVPAQTSFLLSPHFSFLEYPSLLLERGVHKPPPAEHLAPFYRDPAQRIAALAIPDILCYLVFPVEALVELAEGREGCEIEWDEWKEHVVIPSIHVPDLVDIWVSGCQLFCITSPGYGRVVNVEVYDFSKTGRVKYLGEQADLDLGGVRYLSSTGVYAKLPCGAFGLIGTGGGWDSVVFFAAKVYHPQENEEGVLHIWSF